MARTLFAITLCFFAACATFIPTTEAADAISTKEWKIPRDLIPGADKLDATKIADREIGKNWLIANGVTFNGDASAIYIVKSSRLIVHNTQDQLDFIDTFLSLDRHVENTVEVQCRLIELPEEEIGAGPFPIVDGNRPGPSPHTIRELFHWYYPGSRRLFGVLAHPQVELLDHLLAQKKEVAQVVLPKVVVKSGQAAVVEFIRQYQNAPEESPPQVRKLSHFQAAVSPVAPGGNAFAERNVTVAVEVKPVVGPDGYTLDLTLHPQLTEGDGFVGCGSPFVAKATSASAGAPTVRIISPQLAPALLVSTHHASSDVSIYDGSTVVFSNLLEDGAQEETAGKDLALGRFPIVAPLTPSGEVKPRKRGLILLVTSRMLTPDHKPLRPMEDHGK